jgi:hypothetical protein
MLLSKLTFRADVTDRSGAEIDLVVQGGSRLRTRLDLRNGMAFTWGEGRPET